ncbi:MAG: leucyl/phenylalanyl-tRNA--protein transferase [Saprospiraceae bacterium]|jgi:leucyl/phenylalanyl-tRNA--protein transferase|nr:leucyl/phenylalanyl-tRNA--protein transferase [Saprospiraceae bacterium]MBL0025757.1 leucyl/phenylalanyl-tRNA--protein transferase [Saprospiraceae bacterium]
MYYFLDEQISFPHPESVKPSGILAISGDLKLERLLLAYHYGIFPWYNDSEPIIWWCPKPRFVIYPDTVKVAKSMRTFFNNNKYQVTYNKHFTDIIRYCQYSPRSGQDGTWINEDIVQAYTLLHTLGYATSVEVWDGDELVGGLYGVSLGKVFYGESMFSLKSNASRFGFITLAKRLESEGFYIIDCQQPNAYLQSLGGVFISGEEFQNVLKKNRLEWLRR